MEAAEQLGIRIPRLCYHPDLSLAGSCRVCIVDVKGMGYYMAACSSQVWEGMEVQTNSPEIRQARRDIVELLLDNHNMDCQTCERDGHCELQNLAYSMGVRARHFEGRRKRFPIELSSHSVVRDSEKCVLCGRCVRVCAEIQGVYNLSQHGRGFNTVVGPAHLANMDDSVCIQCGQCINVCPTAAFLEKRGAGPVWDAMANPEMHVVVQTAPSIRAAIGEGFGLPPGTPATGQMVTALRRLGFDRVFDTDFGADLTIIEEAHEFLTRLQSGKALTLTLSRQGEGTRHPGPLPMITSCSPGWISFLEKFYPELIPHASTCRSPMSMLSVLSEDLLRREDGHRPEEDLHGGRDAVRGEEVRGPAARAFHRRRDALHRRRADHAGIDLDDQVLRDRLQARCRRASSTPRWALASGAGDIFGTTGGVMEATLRAASELVTGKPADRLEFTEVRGGRGPARNLRGHRRAQHPRRRGQRIDQRQDLARQGEGRQGAVPRDRGDGLSRRLLRRRRAALSARGRQGARSRVAPAAGRRPVRDRRRARSSASRTKTRPSRRSTVRILGGPGTEKAHELLHTHYHAREPRGVR